MKRRSNLTKWRVNIWFRSHYTCSASLLNNQIGVFLKDLISSSMGIKPEDLIFTDFAFSLVQPPPPPPPTDTTAKWPWQRKIRFLPLFSALSSQHQEMIPAIYLDGAKWEHHGQSGLANPPPRRQAVQRYRKLRRRFTRLWRAYAGFTDEHVSPSNGNQAVALQNLNVIRQQVALLALALWPWERSQSERRRLSTCSVMYWLGTAMCQLEASIQWGQAPTGKKIFMFTLLGHWAVRHKLLKVVLFRWLHPRLEVGNLLRLLRWVWPDRTFFFFFFSTRVSADYWHQINPILWYPSEHFNWLPAHRKGE